MPGTAGQVDTDDAALRIDVNDRFHRAFEPGAAGGFRITRGRVDNGGGGPVMLGAGLVNLRPGRGISRFWRRFRSQASAFPSSAATPCSPRTSVL